MQKLNPLVVILAGGLATRLRPLTEKIPKALLEVSGKPFLYHQLSLLKVRGVRKVHLCLGYLGKMVENWVRKNYWNSGMKITFSYDGPTMLGTAGALTQALPYLDESFLVMYGDSYLDCNYLAVYQKFIQSGKQGLMTVFKNRDKWDTSNVVFIDGNLLAYDKKNTLPNMFYVDWGLSGLKKSLFTKENLGNKSDLSEVYQELVKKEQMIGYEVFKRFFEIGSHTGLDEFREKIGAIEARI